MSLAEFGPPARTRKSQAVDARLDRHDRSIRAHAEKASLEDGVVSLNGGPPARTRISPSEVLDQLHDARSTRAHADKPPPGRGG